MKNETDIGSIYRNEIRFHVKTLAMDLSDKV